MLFSTIGFAVQILGILTSTAFDVSEGSKLTVAPDQGATFTISRRGVGGSKCTVCAGEGRKKSCSSASVTLGTGNGAVPVEFTCSNPAELFTVEVIRDIECSSKSCKGGVVSPTDSAPSSPLRDFDRTFTWNLRASGPQAVRLNFSRTGLRQIRPTESCPGRGAAYYTLWAFQRTGRTAVGTFCSGGGPIAGAQVLSLGRLALHVPAGGKLPEPFGVDVGEDIKSLALITVAPQEGVSTTELYSPNYPSSFPDDDQMEWRFVVPPKHNRTVAFLSHTQPRCLKKAPAVEYQSGGGGGRGGGGGSGGGATVLRLADAQPAQQQGSFSLTLRNCEMDRTRGGSAGLSLHFQVSTTRRSLPVLCNVDLRKEKGLSLHIEKTKAGSDCELRLDSLVQESVTVAPGSDARLSFHDCSPRELKLTARTTIECRRLSDCPVASVPLTVPVLAKCLPAPLHSVTWRLLPPPHATVELLPPAGGLRYSLPGRPCSNASFTLGVAEDDDGGGVPIGRFCPQGGVRKVQVHANATVYAVATGTNGLSPASSQPLLNVSFSKEISERYIFTVHPKKKVPLLLATPGWPAGMDSYATVSWIVTVPPGTEAHVMFVNVTQPKCSHRHTGVRVQSLGSLEEMYSRREDEDAGREITVRESFYLNMSNCMAERGAFGVLTQVTLHHNNNRLLTIVLSAVAGLLVVIVTVLVAVCLVLRMKKKRQLAHQVSIYNPAGHSFVPGHNGFPKTREDNESHVYASIEDTMVYTHLLRGAGAESGIHGDPEVDVYREFTGPTGDAPPGGVMEGAEVGVYQPFVPPSHHPPPVPNRPPSHHAVLTDNDIYNSE